MEDKDVSIYSGLFTQFLIFIVGILLLVIEHFLSGSPTWSKLLLTFGTFILGIGVTGIVTTLRNNNFHNHFFKHQKKISEKQLNLIDSRITDISGQQNHDEVIKDKYCGELYLYHNTSCASKGEADNIWIETIIDFSKSLGLKRKTIQISVNNPDDGELVVYQTELISRRSKLIIFQTNTTHIEEAESIFVFDRIGVNNILLGVLIHIDWRSQKRISMSVLSNKKLEDFYDVKGVLVDEIVTKFWKDNYLSEVEVAI